ncbi:hypothetical protein GCM10023238_36750 [Streptomyces heliomycini]
MRGRTPRSPSRTPSPALLECLGEVAGDGVHPGLFTEVFWASLHGIANPDPGGTAAAGGSERRVGMLVDRLAVL